MTISLFLTQILHVTYFNSAVKADVEDGDIVTHQKIYEYFGTFTRCVLSMFELTLANWPPVTRLLSEEVSEWFVILCVCHKLTIGFAVIGIINGVILQETFKVAQTDDMIMMRQKKMQADLTRSKMHSLLQALDHNEDGDLSLEEFEIIGNIPEVKLWLSAM